MRRAVAFAAALLLAGCDKPDHNAIGNFETENTEQLPMVEVNMAAPGVEDCADPAIAVDWRCKAQATNK